MKIDTLIINGHIIDGAGLNIEGWIAVSGDRIYELGQGDAPLEIFTAAEDVVDAHGGYIIPGLIDSHVHFRTPGMEYKGNIHTESRAAVMGAVTNVFDMPNTSPATTSVAALMEKYAAAYRADCRIGFKAFFGAAPGCMKELRHLDKSLIAGIKLFMGTTTGAMGAPEETELGELMAFCAGENIPVMVHAEDNATIAANAKYYTELYGSSEAVPVSLHSAIRSREACLKSSAAAVEMALRYGTRLHLAHISTLEEVRELLTEGPTAGKQITAETTPLYLDPVISDPSARTWRHKVNPAIKTTTDAEALRNAVLKGAIDTIGTDHAPHLRKEKEGGALTAASGAPSLQFALPVMMEYLPLPTIVEKMTTGVATIFGLGDYGALHPGQVADLAIIGKYDPYRISDSDVITPCGWTPFHGHTASHRVEAVWHEGQRLL